MVEIHDGPNPSVMDLVHTIRSLRQLAHENNVPFFVFTTIREPTSYSISFFNFENVKHQPGYEAANATEKDFMRLSLYNPQCLWFARGDNAMTAKTRDVMGYHFSYQECHDRVYPVLLQTMDWIGRLETFDQETIPLLSWMMTGGNATAIQVLPQNQNRAKKNVLRKDSLSDRAQQFLQNYTQADQELYQRVQQDYTMEKWTNFFLPENECV